MATLGKTTASLRKMGFDAPTPEAEVYYERVASEYDALKTAIWAGITNAAEKKATPELAYQAVSQRLKRLVRALGEVQKHVYMAGTGRNKPEEVDEGGQAITVKSLQERIEQLTTEHATERMAWRAELEAIVADWKAAYNVLVPEGERKLREEKEVDRKESRSGEGGDAGGEAGGESSTSSAVKGQHA
ncbi:hypothetical protein GMRT_15286 [Giardia muris]|uniref:Uncharacterized protein n=1 Tax=Giardia muris TaxID=5742 RepID=A0A4Z1SSC8_GIAMU|nr:hypothetical protein GMRT_15286 [Giardia muris]|eukprot:TNJ27895.1 hypothetical protein GMRT_15286 [Giardia muris]